MDVVKATEVREKAAVEECRGLRGEVSSLLERVERERSSLQSKVDLQSSKVYDTSHSGTTWGYLACVVCS